MSSLKCLKCGKGIYYLNPIVLSEKTSIRCSKCGHETTVKKFIKKIMKKHPIKDFYNRGIVFPFTKFKMMLKCCGWKPTMNYYIKGVRQ